MPPTPGGGRPRCGPCWPHMTLDAPTDPVSTPLNRQRVSTQWSLLLPEIANRTERACFSFAITVTWSGPTRTHSPRWGAGRLPGSAGRARPPAPARGPWPAWPACPSAAGAAIHLRAVTTRAGRGRHRPAPRAPDPGHPGTRAETAGACSARHASLGGAAGAEAAEQSPGPARNSRRAGAASLKTGEGEGAGLGSASHRPSTNQRRRGAWWAGRQVGL